MREKLRENKKNIIFLKNTEPVAQKQHGADWFQTRNTRVALKQHGAFLAHISLDYVTRNTSQWYKLAPALALCGPIRQMYPGHIHPSWWCQKVGKFFLFLFYFILFLLLLLLLFWQEGGKTPEHRLLGLFFFWLMWHLGFLPFPLLLFFYKAFSNILAELLESHTLPRVASFEKEPGIIYRYVQ